MMPRKGDLSPAGIGHNETIGLLRDRSEDMSAILQINRDFPFQVALSFDDAAMEVLEWLEGCDFPWDMYVDLPANAVRYCFRTIEDATGFKRRFAHAAEGRAVAGRN
jgi:hypothetical protein